MFEEMKLPLASYQATGYLGGIRLSKPAFAQGFGGSPRCSSLQQAAGYFGEGE